MKFATAIAAEIHMENALKKAIAFTAIYGLFHEGKCLYIGRSTRPNDRLHQHRCAYRKRAEFIPAMRILDLVPCEDSPMAEGRWIEYFQSIGQAQSNKDCRIYWKLTDVDNPYRPNLERVLS